MRRLAPLFAAALLLFMFVPSVLAADTLPHSGRVLFAANGNLTLPAGEQADMVMVVRGTATVAGQANTVVVIDGTANLEGARVETVVAVRSPLNLGTGTVVSGDVFKLDSVVSRTGDAVVGGSIRDAGVEFWGLGLFLGGVLLLIMLGFAVAALFAALAVAALAARQVRAAGQLITHEPARTFGVGLLGGILLPVLAVLAMVTIIGIPLGLGLLIIVLPTVAFAGYMVAAIWIGDWILGRTTTNYRAERPYRAAIVGVLVLVLLGVVPLVSAIASLFGFGAVILYCWRTLREGGVGTPAPLPVQPIGDPAGA